MAHPELPTEKQEAARGGPFSREFLLKDAEARFGAAFDFAGISMVLVTPTGRMLRVNKSFSLLVGIDEPALLSSDWQSLAHPDDARSLSTFMGRTLSGKDQALSTELRLHRPDGKAVYVLLSATLVRNESEVPLYFFCQIFDITERKLIEDQLRIKNLMIHLMQEVTGVTSRASTPDDVLCAAMNSICSFTGWPLAHVYRVAGDGRIVPSALWEPADAGGFGQFKAITDQTTFAPGEGLPGRVIQTRQPAWIDDIPSSDDFVRQEDAMACGLKSAFAIPVITEEKVETILEFFSMTEQDTRPAVIEVMDQIGHIIGQTRERKSVEISLREERERMRQVIETANDAFVEMDEAGKVTGWNNRAMEMFGWSRHEVFGQELCEIIIPPRYREAHRTGLAQFIQTGVGSVLGKTLEVSALRRDGAEFPVELTIWSTKIDDDYRFNAFLRDIAERQAAETALQKANTELTTWVGELERRNKEISLLNQMSGMLQSCATKDEAHAVVSDFTEQLFPETNGFFAVRRTGEELVDVVGVWGDETHSHNFAANDCWALRRGRNHVVRGRGVQCAHLRSSGERYVCAPLTAQGETFGVLHVKMRSDESTDPTSEDGLRLLETVVDQVAMVLVNLALQEVRDDLHSQSIRDPLTGLFNRRYMEESLDRELKRAARGDCPLGLIMIDIDHFKQVNDTHGHEVGDAVLRALGDFLQRRIRGEDIACRFGGEEFVLILPDASAKVTLERALEIVTDFKEARISYQGSPLATPTLSAGVAIYPADGTGRNSIIRAVDDALYQAKEAGRDRVASSHGTS